MLKTEGDTLESYLAKIEADIRASRPEWDRHFWIYDINKKGISF